MKRSNHATDNISKSIVALVDLHHSTPSDIHKFKINVTPTSILTLLDPSAGIERQYLSVDSHIYEIQSLPHMRSLKYSSFFVGSSTVVSEPHLHLLHRVDPLFFILPKFKPTAGHNTDQDDAASTTVQWQPWNQLVQTYSIPQSVLAAIPPQTLQKQLNHLFQRSDKFGEDLILYKFKEDKVLNWLKLKMDRIISTLKESVPAGGDIDISGECSENVTTGAFSPAFRPSSRNDISNDNDGATSGTPTTSRGKDDDDSPPNTITPDCHHNQMQEQQNQQKEETYLKHSAVQILCESLSPPWQTLFLQSVQMTIDDVLSSAAIAKKRRQEKLLRAGNNDEKRKNDKTTQDAVVEGSSTGRIPSDDETNKDLTTMNESDIHPSRVTTPPPPRTDEGRKSSSDGLALSEAEKLLQYTMGGGGTREKGSGSTSGGTKRGNVAKSFGLKRLEKVNTKGMKSLTSFFGAGVGKKSAKKAKLG